MNELDIYPVGLFMDVKHRRVKTGLRRLAYWTKRREWRAVKNHFNGFLCEPRVWPEGARRCGSGWTRRRALKSWQRIAAAVPATTPEAKK